MAELLEETGWQEFGYDGDVCEVLRLMQLATELQQALLDWEMAGSGDKPE